MMKITLALLLAGASAVAPPRIELSLSGTATQSFTHDHASASAEFAARSTGVHDDQGNAGVTRTNKVYTKVDGEYPTDADGKLVSSGTRTVTSRQDWSEKCDANTVITETNCPSPTCKAYDHNDDQVDCKTNYYLIDFENSATYNGQTLPLKMDAISNKAPVYDAQFKNKRMTWLFKYDAQDTAGNHAEQVVFALIVNDETAPVITNCYAEEGKNDASITIEAGALSTDAAGDYTSPTAFCAPTAVKPPISALDTTQMALLDNAVACTGSCEPADAWLTEYQYKDAVDYPTWRNSADAEASLTITYKIYHATHDKQSGGQVTTIAAKTETKTKIQLVRDEVGHSTNACPAAGPCSTSGRINKMVVEATVDDKALYYGANGESNKAVNDIAISIQDKQEPVLTSIDAVGAFAECCQHQSPTTWKVDESQDCKQYLEPAVTATDANDETVVPFLKGSYDAAGNFDTTLMPAKCGANGDTACATDAKPVQGTTRFTVDVQTTAAQKNVYHFARDTSGNWAKDEDGTNSYFRRTVRVVDRMVPTVTLTDPSPIILQSTKANADKGSAYFTELDAGVGTSFTAKDTCVADADLETKCTMTWDTKNGRPGEPDFQKLQDYYRIYKCCDRDYTAADETFMAANCDGTTAWSFGTHGAKCCMDASEKAVPCCSEEERKFSMVDAEDPTIKVMGNPNEVLDASQVTEYTDAGATCNDYVDGVLSHAVEVSGEVVDMRKTGKYTIRYDCTDLTGHAAKFATRTVTIVDKSAPKVTLTGAAKVYVEAGFPYEDAGFTVTDDLDGDGTTWAKDADGKIAHWAQDKAGCMVDGETVTDSCRHADLRSCTQIKKACPACTSGNYCILGKIDATAEEKELEVWCDMTKDAIKTLLASPADTATKSIQSYETPPHGKYATTNWCNTLVGWEMAQLTNAVNMENAKIRFDTEAESYFEPYECEYANATEQEMYCENSRYLCQLTKETDDKDADISARGGPNEHSHNYVGHGGAEVGSFTIRYYCKDAAGNKDKDWGEGTPVSRSVEVQDTLAPVITLHLQKPGEENKRIASSVPADAGSRIKGLNGVHNPAELTASEMVNLQGDYAKMAKVSCTGAGQNEAGQACAAQLTEADCTGACTWGGVGGNGNLMAETTTSVNGWIIGALASAVSGLALLGYSLRKTNNVVTSVPV
jgi:hypothetical protein